MSGGATLLVEVAAILAALSGVLWWLGKGMPGRRGEDLGPVSSIRLNASDSLHVIEVEGRRLLVGTGAGAPPRLICSLDEESTDGP